MEFVYSILIMTGLYIILAASFDLILGHGGLVSIAHPIFAALGAYVSALISMHFGIPIALSIVLGAGFAAIASIGLALPSLRVSGDYLLIASIGFQLGILHVIKNVEFTGGPSGLSGIPSLVDGPSRSLVYLLAVIVVTGGVVWLIRRVVRGDYGRALAGMRDDELALAALGRNAMRIKLTTFALGSGLAGLAGALYAHYFLYVTPEQFEIPESAAILTMVVVGGMRSTLGPIVGALLIVALPQSIKFLDLPPAVNAPLQGLFYTTLVMFFLFARPQGVVGAVTGTRTAKAMNSMIGSDAWRSRRHG